MGDLQNKKTFVFGEAEKGAFCTPLCFHSLAALAEELGNPPTQSSGIDHAVQLLLFQRKLIYFRVKEEGFSKEDYLCGIDLLERRGKELNCSAICIPGVGDPEIIDPLASIGKKLRSILVLTEQDFFDYVTGSKY